MFKFARKQKKIFVIGRNKTGTTSMKILLEGLGYKIGKQSRAETLIENWARDDFLPIVKYCRSADAFQDIPFSLPKTYVWLDQYFPDSKFILTVRSSPDEWYDSLTRFHTRIVGRNRLPTMTDLQLHPYRFKGYLWRMHQLVYGADETNLYDRERYITHYLQHNEQVRDYFKERTDQFLEVDLSSPQATRKLNSFLGPAMPITAIPHANATG